MKLLCLCFLIFPWTCNVFADWGNFGKKFEEISFEYRVTDGKLSSNGTIAKRPFDEAETDFLPEYIPPDITSLCITTDPELPQCDFDELVLQELKRESVRDALMEPKKYSCFYYVWKSPIRAAIGFYVSQFRKKERFSDNDSKAFNSLNTLILYNTSLEEMKGYIFVDMEKMKTLYVDSNNLTKLTKKMFSNCPDLKNLSLVDNDISSIERGSFDYLEKLTELRLGHNSLSVFDISLLYPLLHLKVLKLNNNKISIQEIKSTGSYSFAKVIGFEAREMAELRILDLHGNQLSDPVDSWLRYFPYLEELNLAENKIKTIRPDLFTKMKHLRVLNLSSNKLKVPQASWFKALKPGESKEQVELLYQGNEWECDCDMLQYYEFYESQKLSMERLYKKEKAERIVKNLEITCFQPDLLEGKVLNSETVHEIKKAYHPCSTEREKGTKHQSAKTWPSDSLFKFEFNVDPNVYPYVGALSALLIISITYCCHRFLDSERRNLNKTTADVLQSDSYRATAEQPRGDHTNKRRNLNETKADGPQSDSNRSTAEQPRGDHTNKRRNLNETTAHGPQSDSNRATSEQPRGDHTNKRRNLNEATADGPQSDSNRATSEQPRRDHTNTIRSDDAEPEEQRKEIPVGCAISSVGHLRSNEPNASAADNDTNM